MGRRKVPVFAIVAADKRRARDGRYIEDVGRYYPLHEPAEVKLKEDRVLYWLEQGAQPSDTVRSILSKRGLMLALHMRRKGYSEPQIEEAVAEHRERHEEIEASSIALTDAERRKQALEAERERVAKLEAEEAERKRKEEEERKRKAAEAKKKAEEEAKAKAKAEAEAKAAAEAAEEAKAAEEAEAGTEADAEDADATAEDADATAEDAEADAASDADEAEADATAADAEADATADEETDETKDT